MSWKSLSPFQVKWKLHNSLHSYCQSQTGEKVKKKTLCKNYSGTLDSSRNAKLPLTSQYNSTHWYTLHKNRRLVLERWPQEGNAKFPKKKATATHIPILVKHPNHPVCKVEDVPPVKIRHVIWAFLWGAAVQEVEDVFGGERRHLQTPVDEIHHRRITDGVLKWKEEGSSHLLNYFFPTNRSKNQ